MPNPHSFKEITNYLNKNLPHGYVLIIAPPEEGKTLFGMMKSNPQHFAILELVEKFVMKISNWTAGGSLN